MSKLDDIESRNNIGGEIDVYELIGHKTWLINHIKKLEAVITRYSERVEYNWDMEFQKALSEDE